jgi:hypothetical protein
MTRLAPIIFAGLILGGSMAALAQDTYAWTPDTRVTIQPTSRPGAVAEVVFLNTEIHTAFAYAFPLTLDGLTVSVAVEINAEGAADRYTVTPPAPDIPVIGTARADIPSASRRRNSTWI